MFPSIIASVSWGESRRGREGRERQFRSSTYNPTTVDRSRKKKGERMKKGEGVSSSLFPCCCRIRRKRGEEEYDHRRVRGFF